MNLKKLFDPRIMAACFCLLAGSSTAAELKLECPVEFPAAAVQIIKPPAGWTPFTPTFLPLHSMALMTGPPANKAMLRPESEVKRPNGLTVVWKLEGLHDIWLSCGYGEANEVTLSKQLPGAPSECAVNYLDRKPPAFTQIELRCK